MAELILTIAIGLIGAGIVGIGGVKLIDYFQEKLLKKRFLKITHGKEKNVLPSFPNYPHETVITHFQFKDEEDKIHRVPISESSLQSGGSAK